MRIWDQSQSPKIMLWDQSLRLLVLWSQNSIFLLLGLDPRTRNSYLWDLMLSSNPISSPCGELRDQSLNCILWTLGSLHFFDTGTAGIDPSPWLGLLIFTSLYLTTVYLFLNCWSKYVLLFCHTHSKNTFIEKLIDNNIWFIVGDLKDRWDDE